MVLDNCEHLVDTITTLVERLFARRERLAPARHEPRAASRRGGVGAPARAAGDSRRSLESCDWRRDVVFRRSRSSSSARWRRMTRFNCRTPT